ncbi:TonB-dependent receptor plug domain-containing protein, partial [candidate division KSB1 bacterium]|nr:TonB-dependent receptor plug domain-containing protein [candidate division KSB1 bacterium]
IAGTVQDAKSGEALPGANVFIDNTSLGAATGLDGNYFILNVPPGNYSLKVTMIGYKSTMVKNIQVKIDQTTPVDISLIPTHIEGEEVVVVAERPAVEIDLTASKQTMSTEDIDRSWGTELEEVISDLPGVNINGGIRGGFGLHEAYRVDGMDMRDVGSNTNFKTVNLSTIQEVEVLTGGFNAEYGQANGAIMNIVTKSASDRIHAIYNYRMRPAGKYHWGKYIYGADTFQRTVMCTPEFWDPNSTWQSQWMDEAMPGYGGDIEPFVNWTPEQRAEWWKNFVNDEDFHAQMNYAERMEWETELTVYGPLTKKLGFMLSGRYREGVPRYPSALKYNPDMTFQGALNYQLSTNTKFEVSGVYTKFKNSGASKTNFASTEDTYHDNSPFPFVTSPYDRYTYWMYGASSSSQWNIRAPEYSEFFSLQGKITHTFSPRTFMQVAVQHSRMDYRMDYRDVMKTAFYPDSELPFVPAEYPYSGLPIQSSIASYKWAFPGDVWSNRVRTNNTTIKYDLTSQIMIHHQIKTGVLFSYQKFDKVLHDHQNLEVGKEPDIHVTDLGPSTSHPYEGAFYIQDKMEFEGMVINAGVRVDFFDANKTVAANFFDPLMISDRADDNPGLIGRISFNPDGSGDAYKETPTRWAVSPRFGISHPISENTVLHFMYGEFYQRPPWQKIAGPILVETNAPLPEEGGNSELNLNPDSVLVNYNFYTHYNPNPALEFEKMTQYEVGVKQNIADMFNLDVTMYYRDAHNLTSRGISRGSNAFNNTRIASMSRSRYVVARLYGDPSGSDDRILGKSIGLFETYVNGAWAQVRGIEATFGTKFRYINLRANYTLSFLTSGVYHVYHAFQYYPDKNTFSGADNNDNGTNGVDDDAWNPHNSAFLKLSLMTPKNFGPVILSFYPFENLTLHTSTTWAQGSRFTYYAPGTPDRLRVPNNRRWKDRWNTNMNITKEIELSQSITFNLSVQVKNLFNQKHLRLPGSSDRSNDRIRYFEEGKLPVHDITLEPLEWNWYYNRPREIYVGMGLEF